MAELQLVEGKATELFIVGIHKRYFESFQHESKRSKLL